MGGGRHLDGTTGRVRYVAQTIAQRFCPHSRLVATALLDEQYPRQRGSAFGGLLMATALLGDCCMPAAVLLVVQACKSDVALLVSQSPVIDQDKEAAAAEP